VALQLFGLTGGIGSGKSTVGRRFRQRGVPVIDADELARAVVAEGTPGLAAVVARFGEGVLLPDGTLDRKKLAARVFGNDEDRRDLNRITHPRVGERFAELTAELASRGEPLACYEVPLLFEVGLDAAFRPVVVVDAPVDVQVERTVRRDGATRDEALDRVRAQIPLAEKARRADYVIDNTGTLAELMTRTDDVLDAVCRQLGVDPARYPRLATP